MLKLRLLEHRSNPETAPTILSTSSATGNGKPKEQSGSKHVPHRVSPTTTVVMLFPKNSQQQIALHQGNPKSHILKE